MPVHIDKNKKGCYAKWGDKGSKFYYECGNDKERKKAEKKAENQGRAAWANGYEGGKLESIKTIKLKTNAIKGNS